MSALDILMHLLGGMAKTVLPLALNIWWSRLAGHAGVPTDPRAERWLLTAVTVAAGGLLGWGVSAGRGGAVEMSGSLLLFLAVCLVWQAVRSDPGRHPDPGR